jgi:hypothetical protein
MASSAWSTAAPSSGITGVVFDLRFARGARHDTIDAVTVIWPLGLQNEAELFEHALGSAQQFENFGLFRFRTRFGLSRLPATGGFLCSGP